MLDFHSLRHTTASLLTASGAHPSVAQAVMRHSTVELTMNAYTHAGADAERAAVAALPALRATGTDGEKCLAVCLPTSGEKPCNSLQSNAELKAGNGARGEAAESTPKGDRVHSTACLAEGVGFEPTRDLSAPNGFQNRRLRPLGHPSEKRVPRFASAGSEPPSPLYRVRWGSSSRGRSGPA